MSTFPPTWLAGYFYPYFCHAAKRLPTPGKSCTRQGSCTESIVSSILRRNGAQSAAGDLGGLRLPHSALPPCVLPPAGYAVLEDFATQDEVRQLREQAEKLMRGDAGGGDAAIFSTTNQVRPTAAVLGATCQARLKMPLLSPPPTRRIPQGGCRSTSAPPAWYMGPLKGDIRLAMSKRMAWRNVSGCFG